MMERLVDYLRYTLRFMRFFATNLYTLPVYITWMVLASPLRVLAPSIFWKFESFLFCLIQGMIVTWIKDYPVLECGDDISQLKDDEALVLVNHQSTADTPVVMLATYNKGQTVGKTTWIMWYIFKYTNFGLVSLMRDDFFIHNGRDVRVSEMERLKNYMLSSYLDHGRKWVFVFPEGGFLRKRLEASQAFARKNNLPVLSNVTLPRVGAVQSILSTVGEQYQPASQQASGSDEAGASNGVDHQLQNDAKRPIKWVIDMTLAYKDGQPLDMLGMCIGSCPYNLITLHYKAYRVKDIPRDTANLTDWLYKRYTEKEAMLEHIYKTGRFSDEVLSEHRLLKPMVPTLLRFDLLQNILIHAFVLCSGYLHYVFLYKPLYLAIGSFISYLF